MPASRRATFAAAALLLLLAPLPTLAQDEAPRVRVLDAQAAGSAHGWRGFDTPGPALFDLDGDGGLEIIDQDQGRRVVVVDGRSGAVRAELEVPYPAHWGARPLNEVAVARMAPGEAPSLLVGTSAGGVVRYQFLGREGAAFRFAQQWSVRLDAHEPNPGMDGMVVPVDLDGDGRLEVLGRTERSGAYALRGDGSVLWSKPLGGGNAEPAWGDLDGDGRVEVVLADDGGHVRVLDGTTGEHRWTYWVGKHVRPGAIPIAPLVEDLDGDGKQEVAFLARDAHDAVQFRNNHLALVVLEHDGKERFAVRPSWANPLSTTHLVAADADGDGSKELFGMDWNTIGHKPGDWAHLGPAHAFSFGARGEERWHVALENWWSNDDVAVVDFDGDGALEVLAVGVHQGRDGLWVLDARTGEAEQHASVWPWMVSRGPEVGDVDGDGRAEAVVSVHGMAEGTRGGAFAIVRSHGSGPGSAPVVAPPGQAPAPAPAPGPGPEPAPAPEPGAEPAPPREAPPAPPPRERERPRTLLGDLLRPLL